LSKEGVDIDARNAEGTTALMHAAAAGHKEIIKRMLMKGVNRHLRDNHEKRAIDIARELGKN
jgi:ankyrin repeat protein